MPFDDNTFVTYREREIPKFIPGREGARQLMTALREILPTARWKWNFDFISNNFPECGTAGCAMGFAQLLWPDVFANPTYSTMAERFGMSTFTARQIFYYYGYMKFYDLKKISKITPAMVADKIEEWLKQTE